MSQNRDIDDPYTAVRRDEYSTLGDAYRMCRQDPEAFAAGTQYALDKITGNSGPFSTVFGTIMSESARNALRQSAAEILTRALNGEPQ